MFADKLAKDDELQAKLLDLEGRRLACHCRTSLRCHGDIIIESFVRMREAALEIGRAPPPTMEAALGEAAQRREAAGTSAPPAKLAGRQSPTVRAGHGDPLFVSQGRSRRLFADGGGLCSPGQWPPSRRLPESGVAAQFQRAILGELAALPADKSARSILAKLMGGELTSDPFPTTATERLRDYLKSLVRDFQEVPDPPLMDVYATGVPLGLGVDLPRTPMVFPPKVKWSLGEQEDWGGASARSSEFQGITRANYPSAETFAKEVTSVLDDQAARGQVLVLPEPVARSRFGDRLTVASLAAIEKGTSADGTVEVRVIHDGTHGVDVNRYIKVLDGAVFPTSADLKCCLREQAESGAPHLGLTLDVKEAHRCVAVREEDWPLQACQVHPGGLVYINMVGTYGVASAAYWWGRLAAVAEVNEWVRARGVGGT